MSERLVSLLNHPRCARPVAVHDYDCKYWRVGKKHGPCTCGARDLDAQLREALIAAGVGVTESPDEKKERKLCAHDWEQQDFYLRCKICHETKDA